MSNRTVTIATTSLPVRDSLNSLCATLDIATTDNADLWLIDGYHAPALNVPKGARIITLGPIPKDIVPTHTVPAPATLHAVQEALAKCLGGTSFNLRGGWTFDAQHRSLNHANETSIALTEKEAALLHALASAYPGETSREALLKQVWAYDKDIDTHTVETHIYRLRHKCEAATHMPCEIVTKESGYRLVI